MDIFKTNKKNIILGLAIVLVVILIDQLTKGYINRNFDYSRKVVVIEDFFNIVHVRNTGAAWSILQNNKVILIGVNSIILILTAIFMLRSVNTTLTISLALIIGGGLGNLIDRIFRGSVIDFFEFKIFGYNFPVFNVADMCVVSGSILLAIFVLLIYKEDMTIHIPFKRNGRQ